jgi:HPt (histidine-containing phosphotransfer) domain-containing protein
LTNHSSDKRAIEFEIKYNQSKDWDANYGRGKAEMFSEVMPEDKMKFSEQLIKLDYAVALERLGGDEELLQEVAQLFLDEYPSLMSEIRQATMSANAQRLERAAHSLKGSVSNFGADSAVEAALALEKIGRGGDLTGAPTAYAHLVLVMEQLHPSFEQLAAA